MWQVTDNRWHVTRDTCHLLHVTCHMSKYFFLTFFLIDFFSSSFKKNLNVVELVDGESVNNGAYPV